MELVAVSTFVLVAVLAWFIFPRHKNLPPGPHPFPIIGNLHQLGKNPHWATISPADQTAALEAAHGHYKIPMTFLPIGKEWRKFRKLGREEMFMASRLESSQTLRLEKLERKCDYAGEFCDRGKAVNIGEAIFTAMVNLMFATLFSTEDASFDSNNESSSDDQELLKTTIEGIANIMGRPKSFDPERFLGNNNNNNNNKKSSIDFKGQDFELIQFGAGRRIFPADRMMHITVATLIHKFDLKLVQQGGEDHRAGRFGQALHKAVPLVAIPIKSNPIN